MRPGPRHYAALEAIALARQRDADLPIEADPFAFEDDPGPHSRLVSSFAWHPLMRRGLGLPPIGLFLLGWLSAAIFHVWSRVPQPWGDESFTWELATGNWTHLMERLAGDLHPPLYFGLAKLGYMAGLHDFLQLRVALYIPIALLLGLSPLWITAWPMIWRRFISMAALVLVLFPFDLYLLQLRYYGLLTLLIVTAMIGLANWLEGGPQSRRWFWISQTCFVLATWTNYQSWLIWIIATLLASRMSPDRSVPIRVMLPMLGLAVVGTWLPFALAGLSPHGAVGEAGASPFATGFAHSFIELIARMGVVGLIALATEMVPLWWLPIATVFAILWWLRHPHPVQSRMSPTALICLQTALIMTVLMCVLTASAIPVGVEFLPARLAYVVPLFWIGIAEWILRRSFTLRWPMLLLIFHWCVLGWGYIRCAEALSDPAPAIGAPFLHATYLAPIPGVRGLLAADFAAQETGSLVICATPGLQFALSQHLPQGHFPQPEPGHFISANPPYPLPYTFFLFASTRQETLSEELRTRLRGYRVEEEWLFVHEDPLWFHLKQLVLERDVAPYKYRLTRYRRDPSFNPLNPRTD